MIKHHIRGAQQGLKSTNPLNQTHDYCQYRQNDDQTLSGKKSQQEFARSGSRSNMEGGIRALNTTGFNDETLTRFRILR